MSIWTAIGEALGLDTRASEPASLCAPLEPQEIHRQRFKVADHIARFERAIEGCTDPDLFPTLQAELAKWQAAAEEIR